MQKLKLNTRQLLSLFGTGILLGLAPAASERIAANFTAPTISLVDVSLRYLAKKTELSKEQRSLASIARIR